MSLLALFLATSPGLMICSTISLQSWQMRTSLPGAGLGAWPGVSRGVALTREQQRPHTLCRHTSHRRARLNSPNLVFKHWKHILDF